MPLAGVALAPLLVTHLAPSAPRSCAATAAGRRPSAIRGARCSATAASGEAGELSRATLLWRAAKLPIYSVALVPLTVSHLHDQCLSRYCDVVQSKQDNWD
jgi:1,4-dihydroxy-2-naphthoate octaprenyltransferase